MDTKARREGIRSAKRGSQFLLDGQTKESKAPPRRISSRGKSLRQIHKIETRQKLPSIVAWTSERNENRRKLDFTEKIGATENKTSNELDQLFCYAKSLWAEAPCGSAVHGKVDEMSPAPLPHPPTQTSPAAEPPLWLDPPPPRQHDWWKTRRTRKN